MSRSDPPSRRGLLASIGAGISTAVAGCTGSGGIGGKPTYEDGTVGDLNASNYSNRTASQMSTAAALAQGQPSTTATPLDSLSLTSHEFVVEDGYLGSTIQGTVENDGSNRVQIVEVRTRVYDDAGNQIGRYFSSTGDVDAGSTWEFQVIVLESPSAVADYDIAVLGTPT
ncbi:FxLYD domain-containing protein [Natrinema caseinilyticum]|uniref:FxLYD domain-containing protein n=1 Tax=Natrinema caseinilyticum TaxID=2961570 RepID=UPI0020C26A51|nr:FxLYD domain-containing protein [Natrinema caseinilyticum]